MPTDGKKEEGKKRSNTEEDAKAAASKAAKANTDDDAKAAASKAAKAKDEALAWRMIIIMFALMGTFLFSMYQKVHRFH